MTTTKIGKIQKISLGFGGYQDAMLGLSVTLGSEQGSWGVGDSKGFWSGERSDRCQWSEAGRLKSYGDTMTFIGALLSAAKKDDINKLVGVPIEVRFDGNTLKDWRVLTEAI